MANLKEVRDRIQSVNSTQQITKAMKLVAASKLRRAQQAITQLRPYSEKLNSILSNIMLTIEEGADESGYSNERQINKVCLVVISSNRGLCGAYNSNVIKQVVGLLEEGGKYHKQYEAGNVSMLFIGKKAYDILKKTYTKATLITDYLEIVGKDFSSQHSMPIAEMLMQQYLDADYDAIDIVYAKFRNAAMQEFEVEQFLPIAKAEAPEGQEDFSVDFIFEPPKEDLLEYLTPTILKTQFHKTILDSNASEHGARMTAMDKASENADELLRELKINYNKARQEAITTELGEIVGGAAALESQ
ncbi:ATP synthase F1 subunit gamma [Saprospira grandis]|uniref:ATP synthase F1 subunit gamma n=1 Tax=Saprospira grandis TaxID=1008 RepID=UPI0022DDEC2C|nr:ATP synthase F1 subunit gamma [Saprospira grandis]WBM73198.1 ATP synthase F1 subunit gamma [Saprospira grandis]